MLSLSLRQAVSRETGCDSGRIHFAVFLRNLIPDEDNIVFKTDIMHIILVQIFLAWCRSWIKEAYDVDADAIRAPRTEPHIVKYNHSVHAHFKGLGTHQDGSFITCIMALSEPNVACSVATSVLLSGLTEVRPSCSCERNVPSVRSLIRSAGFFAYARSVSR